MHELSIVESLLEEVQKQIEAAGCRGPVVRLGLRIGRFSGVSIEALRFAFELAKPGTLLAEAQLEIEQVAGLCVCGACGRQTPVEQLEVVCPVCGSPEIQLQGGQELILESIELQEGSAEPEQS